VFWPNSVILGPEIEAFLASASHPKAAIRRDPASMSPTVPFKTFDFGPNMRLYPQPVGEMSEHGSNNRSGIRTDFRIDIRRFDVGFDNR